MVMRRRREQQRFHQQRSLSRSRSKSSKLHFKNNRNKQQQSYSSSHRSQFSHRYQDLNNFMKMFKILHHNDEITVFVERSEQKKGNGKKGQNTFLVKSIEIQTAADYEGNMYIDTFHQRKQINHSQQFKQMLQTLTQHQQFTSKYILKLLNFQVINSSKNQFQNQQTTAPTTYIRAIYEYGQKSLKSQIQKRQQNELYFQEDELWVLLSSLTHPLAYLESENVIYGVLSTENIFLDQKRIKLLDPSCTGINPYEIEHGRLYSPELIQAGQDDGNEDMIDIDISEKMNQIDMFKSDVFTTGIILAQAALLNPRLTQLDQQTMRSCLDALQDRYSQEFLSMLSAMLSFNPEDRPSFAQILEQLSQMFQFSNQQQQTEGRYLLPLEQDISDTENQLLDINLAQGMQCQVNDILFDQSDEMSRKHGKRKKSSSSEQKKRPKKLSAYQQARQKYIALFSSNQKASAYCNASQFKAVESPQKEDIQSYQHQQQQFEGSYETSEISHCVQDQSSIDLGQDSSYCQEGRVEQENHNWDGQFNRIKTKKKINNNKQLHPQYHPHPQHSVSFKQKIMKNCQYFYPNSEPNYGKGANKLYDSYHPSREQQGISSKSRSKSKQRLESQSKLSRQEQPIATKKKRKIIKFQQSNKENKENKENIENSITQNGHEYRLFARNNSYDNQEKLLTDPQMMKIVKQCQNDLKQRHFHKTTKTDDHFKTTEDYHSKYQLANRNKQNKFIQKPLFSHHNHHQ